MVSPDDLISQEIRKTISEIDDKTKIILNKYLNNYRRNNNDNSKDYIKLIDKNNLSTSELDSIKSLKNNKDIIIKPADKGSATVLMNRTSYIKEAERQLNNEKYYKKLTEPIYHHNVKKIHTVLNDLYKKKYISKDQLSYLSGPSDYRARTFYLLPKIHKKRDAWPWPDMPEGRPIVSDTNSETYRISELIDYYLNPLATKHFSYIKNSYEFVNKIRNSTINDNFLLVTGDVSALYTNMNIDRMISCVKNAFDTNKDSSRPDKQLLELLDISLKNNDFEFNDQFYLQILGCAMGKRFAPALANLYLLDFDTKATNDFFIKPLFFVRYLDDIFFVWPGDVESLKQYEQYLNTLIPDIKITLEHNTQEIPFLDALIYKHNNTLQTRPYFKPTDTHQLLHTDSYHPSHTFKGLLKSQLIRFKRLSSTQADYYMACKILFSSLKHRGYAHYLLRKTQYDVWHNHVDKSNNNNTPSSSSSNNNNNNNNNSNNSNDKLLPIIVDYCKLGAELAKDYKTILNNNSFTTNLKLVSAYTNGKNLKQLLVRSKLESDRTGAFWCCDQPRCLTCRLHSCRTAHFPSTKNNKDFNIRDNIYCSSSNLIYVITCQKCKLQYVGETGRSLRDRLTDHRSAIKNKQKTPIGIHFNLPQHSLSDLRILPIELIKNNNNATAVRRSGRSTGSSN